ncbi:hypothetical protein [Clostridium isatidis]|uniref:Uncharacterized protein n=1 Tax=Clostridium isatidis TaxID=182773 RepID=A0A343JFQ5_9CLOT|nr:hypothetical protein [Clostridium isatidis]ASW44363.1 hypothetical protein BEN51_13255 [Clostridium isatidis]
MAFTADFNTPKTASGRYIIVSGIVPANTAFIEVMQLSVSRFESGVDHFYITKEYENSTNDPVTVNETLIIAAVPQITSSDDVTFTSFGSIIGEVDLA